MTELAREVLGFDLRAAVGKVLGRARPSLATEVAQPALCVAGLVSFDAAARRGVNADVLIGHSVGEYTALAAAGAITPRDAIRLVAARGRAMARAALAHPGGMAAVRGVRLEALETICADAGAAVANDNSPDQVVIAGDERSLNDAARAIASAGGRSVLLPVSGAFHTPAMGGAEDALREALDHSEITMPSVPVVSNLTARPYRAPGEIRKLLLHQLTGRVRFRESVEWVCREGVPEIVDFGPGTIAGRLAGATLTRLERADA